MCKTLLHTAVELEEQYDMFLAEDILYFIMYPIYHIFWFMCIFSLLVAWNVPSLTLYISVKIICWTMFLANPDLVELSHLDL